jgi:predicted nucleotidyltransferase
MSTPTTPPLTLVESDNEVFYEVLDEVLAAIGETGVKYILMGGIASTALIGHRFTHDIDLFIRPEDGEVALAALAARGFETERTFPAWLYKGYKHNVMVDLIFKSSGEVMMDDEMFGRARTIDYHGREVRVLSPEDLFFIKALAFSEHTLTMDPRVLRHLNDVLAILRTYDLEWDYIVKRSRMGPRRILSMLLFAQSIDLLVPDRVVKQLVHLLELC